MHKFTVDCPLTFVFVVFATHRDASGESQRYENLKVHRGPVRLADKKNAEIRVNERKRLREEAM